ncbi:Membrane-associated tyrosine- and threonine-specific cdc2-inhibitory kinase [Pelomyxa schiedti]|nr:Membrane-associated tyrosine- and threonine-specific cdc2-inhibitory kinase [Pelomyxa schiedti]
MVGSSPFGPFSTPIQPHADSGSTLLSSLPPPTPPPLYVQEHLAPPAYSYGAGTSILLNDGTPSSNTYNTDRGADVTSHSDGTPQGILTKTDTAAPLNPDNDYGPSPVRRLFIGSEEESQGDSSAEPIVDTNPISIPQPSSPTLNHVSAPQSCATRSTILYPVNLPTITIHSVPLSTTPKMSKPLPLLSGFQSVPRSETQDTCLTPMRMDVEMFRTKRKRAESPQTAPAPPTPQKMTPSMRRTPPPTAPPKIPSLENSGVRTCDFTTVCKLGAGSFGEVFEVESKKTRQRYALKIYRKTSKSSSGKEYYNTKNLGQHVNIVQIYELWEENFHTHILVQLCPNGSLKQRLSQHIDTHLDPDSQDYHLPQDTVLRWCSWIAQGLAHMHRHQIMHLDIKPENCLFDAQDILKIADLGNSSHVKDRDKSEGDSAYMDQQCLKENYGYFCDIFSLGIMMFEIVTHYILPRTGEAFHLLRDGKVMFPSHHNWPYTRELEQLIEGMMNPEFSARPTAVQLLQHRLLVPYVTDSRTAQLVHVTRHLEFSSQTPVAPTATTSTITQPTTPETPSHPATPQVLSPTPSPPQTPTHPSTSYPLPNHNL